MNLFICLWLMTFADRPSSHLVSCFFMSALFRRAKAKAGIATATQPAPINATELLQEAITDVEATIEILSLSSTSTSQEQKQLAEAQGLLPQLQRQLSDRQKWKDTSPEEQRATILKLYQSRTKSLQQAALPGEAFFLVDWNWWSQWCRYVHLFDCEQNTDTLLKCMPPGTVLPKEESPAQDGDESSEEEDYEKVASIPKPGLMDQSELIWSDSAASSSDDRFVQQWWGDNSETILKPNLVRGHDYEIGKLPK